MRVISKGAGRQPEDWVVLEALESLTPPSPSPSFGTDMISLCSSGEIPIMLSTGLDSLVLEAALSGTPALEEQRTSIYTSTRNADLDGMGKNGNISRNQIDLRGSENDRDAIIPQIDAVRLSPTSREARSGRARQEIPSRSDPDSSFFTSMNSVYSAGLGNRPATSTCAPAASKKHGFPPSSGDFTPTHSAAASPVGSPQSSSIVLSPSFCELPSMSIESDCSPSTSPCTSPQFSRFSRSYSSVSMTLFGSGSALSTSPSIATNSTNPSPTTSPRRFLPLKKIQKSRSCSPLQMVDTSTGFRGSSQAPEIDAPNSAPVTPIMPTFNIPALSKHRRTDSTATTNSAKSVRSVRSCHISSPLASPTSDGLQSVNIPGILSWLNGTTIEFWIDQEGIHAVRSTFRLMGYTSEAVEDRDVDLINALTYGLADFMPTYRQVYKFNSSKVDAPPILRRLTKSGDGDKDYISQQASLTVSSNGVYSVSGVEFFDFQPHRAPLVLRWRFEYFVHDSLTEIPGATVQDTKTLTPLRFSCSPGLLHPTHGKKRTTLLQVFKRGPSVRLCAERMEVPRAGIDSGRSYIRDALPNQRDDHSPGPGRNSDYADHRYLHAADPSCGLKRSPGCLITSYRSPR